MLAVLLAATLPWSTSIFLILLIPFLAIVCGSLDTGAFQRSFMRAPSLVSVGLLTLAVVGLLWSQAQWPDRLHTLGPLLKFVVLPVFLYYFELSKRGAWVLGSLFVSCALLLIYSWIVTFEPSWALKTGRCCGEDYGVLVRNYIDQSQEFGVCLVMLIAVALYGIEERAWRRSALLAFAALLFAANLVFVVTSRTAIVGVPAMINSLIGGTQPVIVASIATGTETP